MGRGSDAGGGTSGGTANRASLSGRGPWLRVVGLGSRGGAGGGAGAGGAGKDGVSGARKLGGGVGRAGGRNAMGATVGANGRSGATAGAACEEEQ